MTDPTDLADLFRRAADISAVVPESLREIAFQRALDSLLGIVAPTRLPAGPPAPPSRDGNQGGASHSAATTQTSTVRGQRSASVTRLLEALDRTVLAPKLSGRKALDQALLILREADSHGVPALTPAEISTILKEKFRERVEAPAVRMALDRNQQFTDRRPDGQGYLYTLMTAGESYLDSLGTAESSAPSNSQRRRKSPRQSKAAPLTPEPSNAKAQTPSKLKSVSRSKAAKGRGGRPAPMAAVESLIDEGFFASPKSISTILKHLKEVQAYTFKAGDLSPTLQRLVRKRRLSRAKNDSGQYEYSAN